MYQWSYEAQSFQLFLDHVNNYKDEFVYLERKDSLHQCIYRIGTFIVNKTIIL